MKEYFFEEKGLYYRKNEFDLNKQTLVFIHGLSGSSSAWINYENKFINEYNILTFDLRGHGKSIKYSNQNDYKMEFFVEDIYALIKSLNINKFILISHSLASIIALEFLNKHLDIVSKVILISPQYNVNNMLSAKITKPFIFGLSNLLITSKSKKVGDHIDYSKYKNGGDWNIPRMIADIGNTGIGIYFYCSKQTYFFNGENILDKINIPTLIIHGRKDSIFPIKWGMEINKRIKNSKMSIIENLDHILVLNNFPEVSELIDKFIK